MSTKIPLRHYGLVMASKDLKVKKVWLITPTIAHICPLMTRRKAKYISKQFSKSLDQKEKLFRS